MLALLDVGVLNMQRMFMGIQSSQCGDSLVMGYKACVYRRSFVVWYRYTGCEGVAEEAPGAPRSHGFDAHLKQI
jgi:hypothetical protein